jgi:gas vesicle protein
MADYDDDLPAFVIETRGGGDGTGTFLLGVLVGAAVALLLAPRSGAETQAEIAGAARRLRDDVEGRVSGARERVGGRVAGTLDTVRGGVETRVAQARAAIDVGRGAARDAREELQRRVDEAKRSYRAGLAAVRGDGDGDEGDGAGKAGDVVVTGVVVEETSGELE